MATIEPGDIDETIPPSGEGCEECTATGSWWLHLRRCATCGHVGCCDNSPNQHATKHQGATGHQMIQSFEPGEDWFYDYRTEQFFEGPALAPPDSHPAEQGVPGPHDRVPPDWRSKLNP
jgi:Zn-finger in ubiquitin-hydrolases and other protein